MRLGVLTAFLLIFPLHYGSVVPGYLDFDNLPDTNFSCQGKVIGGYYADVETGCQMFHVCTIGQKGEVTDIKFLCLNGTVFDQETRVCERVDEVDCSKTEGFYGLNLELYGNSAGFGFPDDENDEDGSETQDHVKTEKSKDAFSTHSPPPPPSSTTPSTTTSTTTTTTVSSIPVHPFVPTTTVRSFAPSLQPYKPNPHFPSSPPPSIASFHSSYADTEAEGSGDHGSDVVISHFPPSSSAWPQVNIQGGGGSGVIEQGDAFHSLKTTPKPINLFSASFSTPSSPEHHGQFVFSTTTRAPQHYFTTKPPAGFSVSTGSPFGQQQPNKDHNYQNIHVIQNPIHFQFNNRPGHQLFTTPSIQIVSSTSSTSSVVSSVKGPIRHAENHPPPVNNFAFGINSGLVPNGTVTVTVNGQHHETTPPTSYDEYHESDVSLDPFFRDVPRINQGSRRKRQTSDFRRIPSDIPRSRGRTAVETGAPSQRPRNFRGRTSSRSELEQPIPEALPVNIPTRRPLHEASRNIPVVSEPQPVTSIPQLSPGIEEFQQQFANEEISRNVPANPVFSDTPIVLPPHGRTSDSVTARTSDRQRSRNHGAGLRPPEDPLLGGSLLPEVRRTHQIVPVEQTTPSYNRNREPATRGQSDRRRGRAREQPSQVEGSRRSEVEAVRGNRGRPATEAPLTTTTTTTTFAPTPAAPLPKTGFSCHDKVPGGYYADLEADCQLFHICSQGRHGRITDNKFLCGPGTRFNQRSRTCQVRDLVDCSISASLYHLNSHFMLPQEDELTPELGFEPHRIRRAAKRVPSDGPNYSLDELPETDFTCADKTGDGLYADVQTQCQAFHLCQKKNGAMQLVSTFVCPRGTVFNQREGNCDAWREVDCELYSAPEHSFGRTSSRSRKTRDTSSALTEQKQRNESESSNETEEEYYEYVDDNEEAKHYNTSENENNGSIHKTSSADAMSAKEGHPSIEEPDEVVSSEKGTSQEDHVSKEESDGSVSSKEEEVQEDQGSSEEPTRDVISKEEETQEDQISSEEQTRDVRSKEKQEQEDEVSGKEPVDEVSSKEEVQEDQVSNEEPNRAISSKKDISKEDKVNREEPSDGVSSKEEIQEDQVSSEEPNRAISSKKDISKEDEVNRKESSDEVSSKEEEVQVDQGSSNESVGAISPKKDTSQEDHVGSGEPVGDMTSKKGTSQEESSSSEEPTMSSKKGASHEDINIEESAYVREAVDRGSLDDELAGVASDETHEDEDNRNEDTMKKQSKEIVEKSTDLNFTIEETSNVAEEDISQENSKPRTTGSVSLESISEEVPESSSLSAELVDREQSSESGSEDIPDYVQHSGEDVSGESLVSKNVEQDSLSSENNSKEITEENTDSLEYNSKDITAESQSSVDEEFVSRNSGSIEEISSNKRNSVEDVGGEITDDAVSTKPTKDKSEHVETLKNKVDRLLKKLNASEEDLSTISASTGIGAQDYEYYEDYDAEKDESAEIEKRKKQVLAHEGGMSQEEDNPKVVATTSTELAVTDEKPVVNAEDNQTQLPEMSLTTPSLLTESTTTHHEVSLLTESTTTHYEVTEHIIQKKVLTETLDGVSPKSLDSQADEVLQEHDQTSPTSAATTLSQDVPTSVISRDPGALSSRNSIDEIPTTEASTDVLTEAVTIAVISSDSGVSTEMPATEASILKETPEDSLITTPSPTQDTVNAVLSVPVMNTSDATVNTETEVTTSTEVTTTVSTTTPTTSVPSLFRPSKNRPVFRTRHSTPPPPPVSIRPKDKVLTRKPPPRRNRYQGINGFGNTRNKLSGDSPESDKKIHRGFQPRSTTSTTTSTEETLTTSIRAERESINQPVSPAVTLSVETTSTEDVLTTSHRAESVPSPAVLAVEVEQIDKELGSSSTTTTSGTEDASLPVLAVEVDGTNSNTPSHVLPTFSRSIFHTHRGSHGLTKPPLSSDSTTPASLTSEDVLQSAISSPPPIQSGFTLSSINTASDQPGSGFVCNGKELHQYHADPEDCRLFHYCSPGFHRRQALDFRFMCEGGTAFSTVTYKCENEQDVPRCVNFR